jgi:hypothetical protein
VKAHQDLLGAWTAFLSELSNLDGQDGLAPDRAKAMRVRVTEHHPDAREIDARRIGELERKTS